jgi:hypothetical protein
MPIHDWTLACDAAYHSFQLDWSCRLSERLNHGVLPHPIYAMTETLELRPPAEFCPLPEPGGPFVRRNWDENLPDSNEQPPRTRFHFRDDRRQYACKIVTIRDDLHQPIAAVFWVTRQDKETPYRLDAIIRHAVGALTLCFRRRSATRTASTRRSGTSSRKSRSTCRRTSR